MASTFPGAIDSFTDPLSGSALNSPSHSAQHADLNDAVEKVETYMGLVKISKTTFTAVSTIQFTSAFSSLYTNYQAILSYTASSATATYIRWLVGSTVQTGNILSQEIRTQLSTGLVTASQRSDQYGTFLVGYPTYPNAGIVNFFSPQVATYSSYTGGPAVNGVSSTDSVLQTVGGRNIATTQIDGFEITTASGITLTGTMTLYGYRI